MTRKGGLAVVLIAATLVPGLLIEAPPVPDPVTRARPRWLPTRSFRPERRSRRSRPRPRRGGALGIGLHAQYVEIEAAQCYAETHRLDPKDLRWAILMMPSIRFERSGGSAERGDIHVLLAALYAKRGDYREAERQIQKARVPGVRSSEEISNAPSASSKRSE